MPSATATITGKQRQAIYDLVRDHLSGLNDLFIALDRNDFATAEQLGLEFGEGFRLLEDLGWAENDNRQTVTLTMPAEDLTETLRRLHAEALAGFSGSPEARRLSEEDSEVRARYQLALATCEELMDGLDPRGGGSA